VLNSSKGRNRDSR